MTSVVDARGATALRRAAVRASLAPSVHNTQPWSLRLHDDRLDLHADARRQLAVLDPSGRQLTISCGAALFNARLSLAAAGFDVQVDRFPDAPDRELVARLTLLGDERPQVHCRVSLASPAALRTLDQFVALRHTNRNPFTSDDVPDEVITTLGRAVHAEQGELFAVRSPEHRAAVASIAKRARADLDAEPAYPSEVRGWGGGEPHPLSARGHVSLHRDADGELASKQCLIVVGGADDSPIGWLRSGEAVERMLLETTRQGFVAGPLAQTIVRTAGRESLRTALELTMTPQVVLRIGRAPASLASRRRRLVDVLVEEP